MDLSMRRDLAPDHNEGTGCRADANNQPEHDLQFEQQFIDALLSLRPYLHAYGRRLCGRADFSEDLVQETLCKAWDHREQFRTGSSMQAWTTVILRNTYFSSCRRERLFSKLDGEPADIALCVSPTQEEAIHLADVARGLQALADKPRQALLLVSVRGYSYEQAAELCGCALGTIKSRIARARRSLMSTLDDDAFASKRRNCGAGHGAPV